MDSGLVPPTIRVIDRSITIGIHSHNKHDMMMTDGNHTGGGISSRKLEPVGGEEKVFDWMPKYLDGNSAPAEGSPGATGGM